MQRFASVTTVYGGSSPGMSLLTTARLRSSQRSFEASSVIQVSRAVEKEQVPSGDSSQQGSYGMYKKTVTPQDRLSPFMQKS